MLYKMWYITWVAAPLGACDILGRKLEIVKKRLKLEFFYAGHVEYDIIKHFAAFC